MKWIEKLFAPDPAVDTWMLDLLKDFLAHEEAYEGNREWLVIHSVRAMGEKRMGAAVDGLIEICKRHNDEWDLILLDATMLALENMGPPAFEPIFTAFLESKNQDLKTTFLGIACHLGVKNDRVKAALLENYDADPGYMIGSIAEYDDRDLLPFLYQKLEAVLPELKRRIPARRIECEELDLYIELRDAIIDLEGEREKKSPFSILDMYRRRGKPIDELDLQREIENRLNNEALKKFDRRVFGHEVQLIRFDDEEDEELEAGPFGVVLPLQREQPKTGRNDPCPCGSGKKFKKCCLEKMH